jgi:hypothetical protein
VYTPPQGTAETPEQSRELDDTYLLANPLAYFTSRALMLRSWLEANAGSTVGQEPHQVDVHAGLVGSAPVPQLAAQGVEAQVALDAFALRQHAAEALARLTLAATEGAAGRSTSLWTSVAEGPRQLSHLEDRLRTAWTDLDEEQRCALFMPPRLGKEAYAFPAVLNAVSTCCSWLQRAMDVLCDNDIDLHGANNKAKHGLAVHTRPDMRVDFTITPPNPDGTVPLEAFDPENSLVIFDRPVLEFLGRPASKAGLEVTQLRLDTATLLVEAHMIAVTHAALFHVEAARHFADHEPSAGTAIAPYPSVLSNAPVPDSRSEHEVVGMRWPITRPLSGDPARQAGLGLLRSFIPFAHVGKMAPGVVGERTSPPSGSARHITPTDGASSVEP